MMTFPTNLLTRFSGFVHLPLNHLAFEDARLPQEEESSKWFVATVLGRAWYAALFGT
jgi:hypothetical protein